MDGEAWEVDSGVSWGSLLSNNKTVLSGLKTNIWGEKHHYSPMYTRPDSYLHQTLLCTFSIQRAPVDFKGSRLQSRLRGSPKGSRTGPGREEPGQEEPGQDRLTPEPPNQATNPPAPLPPPPHSAGDVPGWPSSTGFSGYDL